MSSNSGTAAEGRGMKNAQLESRSVAPCDREITVTLTAGEWDLVVGRHLQTKFGPHESDPLKDHGLSRRQAMFKLERQVGS